MQGDIYERERERETEKRLMMENFPGLKVYWHCINENERNSVKLCFISQGARICTCLFKNPVAKQRGMVGRFFFFFFFSFGS